jgi:glycosyltransferase involved in cell wall biosynthesis
MDKHFAGKLAIQQRVLPPYRAAFFDLLAAACGGGLSVFAGRPRPGEAIARGELHAARFAAARNLHFFGGGLYFCWQGGLLDWLAEWDPDALVVEANPRYLSTPAAVRWMKARNRPVIGWGLGAPAPSGPLAGLRRSRRPAFVRQFDALITYSRRGADEYAALGFPAGRIFVAPNAAVPRPVTSPPKRPPTFAGRPTVLFVGRLQLRKRLDDLLVACAALPEQLQPRLVIIGEGPGEGDLKDLAAQIYPSAEFPGAKHGAQLAPYFAAADLFVLPGTGGLAVQEAMAYGLPVIMGQGDGTNDQLVRPASRTAPGNGWQLADEGVTTLAETLRLALSSATRLRKMGALSYHIVREEINLEKMAGVFLEVLDSLSGN